MDMKHYKTVLEKEKAATEEQLGQIAVFNRETNKWEATPDQSMIGEIDENDAADRFEDFEERSSMVQTFQEQLTNINLALQKIENGTYGTCEVGNDHPIEKERLEANPAARTCKAHMNG